MVQVSDSSARFLHELEIRYQPLAQLTPYRNNARTHSPKQIQQLAESIKAFGFVNPVLVDVNGGIIAGHGRVAAARLLNLSQVPTIRLDHLTPEQLQAYILADNRLAELAGWDKEILAIEFQHLLDLDLEFDITITGFETPEIDLAIQSLDPAQDQEDEMPVIDAGVPTVSQLGDAWVLGEHRLVCGDALQPATYGQLMHDVQARVIFTDPPYNVPIGGHVCGKGSIQHNEFAMASGELSETEFINFLKTSLSHMAQCSLPGSLHYICMDWRHMGELLAAGKSAYTDLKNVCVWNKDNGGMGSLYRSKHELVFVFKHGQTPHVNNIELGRYGRYRTNVWDYPGVNTFREGRLDDLKLHPTVKPVALVADAICDASHRGELVLDAFGGSGTTLIAAERVGRQARLIEIEPRYVDVSIRRWEAVTGNTATHEQTGLTLDVLAERRATPTNCIDSEQSPGGPENG